MEAAVAQSRNLKKSDYVYKSLAQAIILVIIYTILEFALPIGKEAVGNHDVSGLEYRILRYCIALPTIFVWVAAFTAYGLLKFYSDLVKKSAEGKAYRQLTHGFGWLVWSSPITSMISLILSSIYYRNHGFRAASIIITNYIAVILPLVAFVILAIGTRQILKSINLRFVFFNARLALVISILASVIYCHFTLSHFSDTSFNSTHNPYYLAVWLMIISVIVPYLVGWMAGLFASYAIVLYRKQVDGVLFKKALSLLEAGLLIIIASSIAMQYLNGILPRTDHLVLNYKLIFSIIFKITSGVGFILLSFGAQRLTKIEEI